MNYKTVKGTLLPQSSAPAIWYNGTSAADIVSGTSLNEGFQGAGGDTLKGGAGDDTYNIWDNRETVVETVNGGIDTYNAWFWGPATLPSNVENLNLLSPGSTVGIGNNLNNIITAGSVGATLNGKAGDDVLVGGSGADLFQIEAGNGSDAIVNFTPGKDVIQLQGYGITTFEQIQERATQINSDVVITFTNGEQLAIRDVNLADLDGYDFDLPPLPPQPAAGYVGQSGPGAVQISNGWYALNNVWNAGTLAYGSDYTITSLVNTADLTSGTTFYWSFPVVTDFTQAIRAYPELIFGPAPLAGGEKPTDIPGTLPVQLSTITDASIDYDVSFDGNTSGFNVTYDIWLTDKPNGGPSSITNEVMIWIHKGDVKPYGDLVGTYSDGNNTANIYHSGTYTAVVFDQDSTSGTIDLDGLFDVLVGLGIVSRDEYIGSIELGSEVVSGSGSLSIHNLDINIQTKNADESVTDLKITGTGTTITRQEAARPIVDTVLDSRYDPSRSVIDGSNTESRTLLLDTGATVYLGNYSSSQVPDGPSYVTGFVNVDASGTAQAVTLNGSPYANVLIGGSADDTLLGGGGNDTLKGGGGNDYLDGGAEPDWLYGEDGDDRIVYDANDYAIIGGDGNDTLILDHAAAVYLGNYSTSQVPGGQAYVSGFENVDASRSTEAVTLNGSPYANVLIGGSANDTLLGGGGNDTLRGGSGNDYLDGGAEPDWLYGEDGDDSIVYDANDYAIIGGDGTDTLILDHAAAVYLGNFSTSQVPGGRAYVSGFENVDASRSTEAVTLNGSQYNNRLIGGSGDDTIYGGGGYDILSGGEGHDTFVFDTRTLSGSALILDFDPGHDVIRLDDYLSSESAANSNIIYNGSTGALSYDPDGSGTHAIQFATIGTNLDLTASNLEIRPHS